MMSKPMSKPKKPKGTFNTVEDFFSHFDNVASATECTGLIPTPPRSEQEAESYTAIYNVPKPEENRFKS